MIKETNPNFDASTKSLFSTYKRTIYAPYRFPCFFRAQDACSASFRHRISTCLLKKLRFWRRYCACHLNFWTRLVSFPLIFDVLVMSLRLPMHVHYNGLPRRDSEHNRKEANLILLCYNFIVLITDSRTETPPTGDQSTGMCLHFDRILTGTGGFKGYRNRDPRLGRPSREWPPQARPHRSREYKRRAASPSSHPSQTPEPAPSCDAP